MALWTAYCKPQHREKFTDPPETFSPASTLTPPAPQHTSIGAASQPIAAAQQVANMTR